MTIWVNVSTSSTWDRPPFGIVRVEKNVALGLRRSLGPERLRFCIWKPKTRAFVELEGELEANKESKPRRHNDSVVLGEAAERGTREALALIRRGVKELMRHGQLSVLGGFLGWTKKAQAKSGANAGRGWFRFGPRQRTMNAAGTGLGSGCLRPGDVLVTLGLEWETGFMPLLKEIKERANIKIVGCCHDLIPMKYPHYAPPYVAEAFPQYLSDLVGACDAIACVSECSKEDLRQALIEMGRSSPSLFTVRLGVDMPSVPDPVSCAVSDLAENAYVLYVSTLERRKNHDILYKAFRRLAEAHGCDNVPRLVFVGARGWGVRDLLNDITFDPLTRGVIILMDRVTDGDLLALYQKALFCVFPSVYEGWGLPVAEALGLGTPVICSNRGSLPEVAGDLVDYVDPWDLLGWIKAIERLWLDGAYRRSKAQRIVREYSPDSWSGTAARIAEVALGLES